MSKKGVKKLVIVLLSILIFVAAVAGTWFFVIPFAGDQVSKINFNVDLGIALDEGYTMWDAENRLAMVQVSHGKESPNLIGLDLIFTFNGNSITYFSKNIPAKHSRNVFYANFSDYPGEFDSLKLVPIFEGQVIGDTLSQINAEQMPRSDIGKLISSGKLSANLFSEPTGSGGIIGAGKIQGRK